jgi:two-component system response regulator FlrC
MILVVEDDASLNDALCETLRLAGYRVMAADDGHAALSMLAQENIGLVISDVKMPGMDGYTLLNQIRLRHHGLPVLLMTAYGTIQNAVEAMRNGAVDYLIKPFDAAMLVDKVSRHLPCVKQDDSEFVAVDPRSRELASLAARVAASDATVLISGKSGTGKEIIARYIHRRSNRADQPFVAINCAAIPENMLEATLFGYEKGAFTGAVQAHEGKFEQAQNGTLLLDEISEISLALQAKLLRVLQEREVERLGGRKLISLNVRVLATTNRALREEVAAGRFREDLFYRLNVFPLSIPALRERPQDILPLAEHLLARSARGTTRIIPQLSIEARERLLAHAWPGNVRELDNLIQRAIILQRGDVIEVDDLRFESGTAMTEAAGDVCDDATADSLGRDLKVREQSLIIEALKLGNGSRKRAAERLGVSPRTLRYKLARMRELGITVP